MSIETPAPEYAPTDDASTEPDDAGQLAFAEPEPAPKDDRPHKVVTTNADERKVFSGLVEDAEEFIKNNFPRIHVQPGRDYDDAGPKADVHLIAPDGSRRQFDGKNFTDVPKS